LIAGYEFGKRKRVLPREVKAPAIEGGWGDRAAFYTSSFCQSTSDYIAEFRLAKFYNLGQRLREYLPGTLVVKLFAPWPLRAKGRGFGAIDLHSIE
jgi:hypothetical protein